MIQESYSTSNPAQACPRCAHGQRYEHAAWCPVLHDELADSLISLVHAGGKSAHRILAERGPQGVGVNPDAGAIIQNYDPLFRRQASR